MSISASAARVISRADILPIAEYAKIRDERRRRIAALKRHRRLHVGPDITFYFESFETMLHQIHEMLFVERGGDAQIEDELRAYNPLIPQGRELVTTMMIEIADPVRRARVLGELGGIETTIAIETAAERIPAVAEADVERTTAEGKTSSVHFLRFPLSAAAAAAFSDPGGRIMMSISHPKYQHIAVFPDKVRAALAQDLAGTH